MKNSRYSTLLRLLLALIAAAGITFWAANTRDAFEIGLHPNQHPRDPFEMDADTRRITSLEPEAERSGMVKGATVESLNGAVYTGQAEWALITNPARPGDLLTVGFRRADGSNGMASITLAGEQPKPGQSTGTSQVWRLLLLFCVLPLLCMLIGYWVVLVRPADRNAWLLLVLLIFPEVVFAFRVGLSTGGWLFFRETYFQLLQKVGPLALLPFAIYFPERSRLDVKLPWMKWAVLGPALLCGLIEFRQVYGQNYLGGNPPWLIHSVFWADRVASALQLACVVLYLVIIFDKLRSVSTQDSRRRLRVLLAGTGTGLSALLIAFVLLPALGYSPSAHGHAWVGYVGAALFLLAPMTLAYVVLVQRAMDVSVLLRQGTKYGLARATIWGVQILLTAVVSYKLLLPLLTEKQVFQDQLWQAALFASLIGMMRLAFSKRSQNWLDRKFFREEYDSELVLSDLSEEVRRFTDSGPLLQTVTKCVAETLHVDQIGMLLRSGKDLRPDFVLAQSIGIFGEDPASMMLESNSSTIRNLGRFNAPAQLYRDNPDPWYLLAGEAERKTLDALGVEVLLPLPGRNRLMGVMSLGPKRSEAAYSKSDLHLLQVLANQTGMALEVTELAHSLAQAAAQRERANREMEIAREVQERLFPQEMPSLTGASIAGACRPAQGVGGDYYDVFELPDGRLGLAIGDVSGKGISAALLMASLRASLRGVTLDNPRDFAKLMDKVNRLVYEASADNRYATFFFGALDPVTHVLECVNAGHNAPLVLRQKPGGDLQILRLEADGPVVGLLPFAPYTEQSVRLEAGDVLLTYTDGISEAMTRGEEEWGEARMTSAAAAAKDGSAEGIMRALFAAVDRFTSGAAQNDDMTLLILKLDAQNDRTAPAKQ